MPFMHVTETAIVAENRSWLPSPHGSEVNANPNITLLLSLFNQASHYPNGYLPSGTLLTKTGGLVTKYDGTVLDGVLLTDQAVVGAEDFPVPVLDHGRIKTDRLPVTFVKPTTDNTTFVYI